MVAGVTSKAIEMDPLNYVEVVGDCKQNRFDVVMGAGVILE